MTPADSVRLSRGLDLGLTTDDFYFTIWVGLLIAAAFAGSVVILRAWWASPR